MPHGITFGNSLSSPRSASNTLQHILHPQTRSGGGLCQHGALQGGAGITRGHKAPPVWGRQGWEAVPSPRRSLGRALSGRAPCAGGLFMCGPGWSGDLPWLNIAAMLSSEFSLAGEFIFCKGWEANGLKTGVEMPERCDSLSAVSGLTQGERAPCPECRPWDGSGEEGECVEGLELSPLAPRGRGGHLKSGSSACVASCLLPGKRFPPPQTLLAGSPGWCPKGSTPSPLRSKRSRERSI